jgi:hypothetical protein
MAWMSPPITMTGASTSSPVVTIAGNLVFPTSDCGGAPAAGQSVTLTNATNQPYPYTLKLFSGVHYTFTDGGSGMLPANGTATIIVNPKAVVPGAGVLPGSAPYGDDLIVDVSTSPATTLTAPISWTLNGAVLSLPQGAGPFGAQGSNFYAADTTSGFALGISNTGTAAATVNFAIQPSNAFGILPTPPIDVLPGIPALPELVSGASAPACQATSMGTATFSYSGPVCQPLPLPSVSVDSCSGTYIPQVIAPPPVLDAGAGDAAQDASGSEASMSSSNAPCTGVNIPAGCTPCTGSANGVCTPSEALVVQRDIDKGLTGANTCYQCLLGSSCLDDTMGDSDNECGDLAGTVGAGAQGTESKQQACLNTLACILGIPYGDLSPVPPEPSADFPGGDVSCGDLTSDGIANCYCGSNYTTTPNCSGASGVSATPVNGVCEQVELDGLGLTPSTSGSVVLSPFTVKTTASGMANGILKCAGTNAGAGASCPVCFQ